MRRAAAALSVAALVFGAGCAARGGSASLAPEARDALRQERVCWASRDGIYIARGDGSDSDRIVRVGAIGKNAAVFLPSMPAGRADSLLFLSLLDLNPIDASGTGLTLHILDLDGDRITFWRRISLAKIVPAGPDGRYTLFSVPAAAWLPEGARIALAVRREEPAGDAVLLMDAEGGPTALIDIAPRRFSRGTSLSWDSISRVLYLGLAGPSPGEPGVIGAIGLKDGERAQVVAPGSYPAVAPDGRIAVVDAGDELAVMGRGGGQAGRVEGAEGRAKNRLFWSRDGRYLYYYALVPSGPLGLGQVTVLRCLDTIGGAAPFDLVRLR